MFRIFSLDSALWLNMMQKTRVILKMCSFIQEIKKNRCLSYFNE